MDCDKHGRFESEPRIITVSSSVNVFGMLLINCVKGQMARVNNSNKQDINENMKRRKSLVIGGNIPVIISSLRN